MDRFDFTTHGVSCSLELRVGGQTVPAPHGLEWYETTAHGAWLEAAFEGGSDLRPRVGDLVVLKWTSRDESSAPTSGEMHLWCDTVRVVADRGHESFRIRAVDVLRFCSEEPQFRSYAGRVPIDQLAKSVLAFQPGMLEGLLVENPDQVEVPLEYVLQCRESGAAFLSRVAAVAGCTWLWSRQRLLVVRAGHAPGPTVSLADADAPPHVEVVETPEPALAGLVWVDTATREGRLANVRREPWSGARGARGLTRPARSVTEPRPDAWSGEGLGRAWNGTATYWTTNATLAPGAIIRRGDAPSLVVDQVRHSASGAGGAKYANEVIAVSPAHWGVPRVAASEAMLGPFQAVVMENDDPERQGRLRVALAEDPERRPAPWAGTITLSAQADGGTFWMPEKGTLVMVVAPAACPECLIVLGSVRGAHERIPARWKSADNAHKALAFRNGVRLVVDDQRQVLRFETAKGAVELDGEGHLRTNGHEFSAEFQRTISLHGEHRVDIDSNRINLGT